MDPLHVAHLCLVMMWTGLAIAESIMEASARDDEGRRHAARLHYMLDVHLELPLLLGVLATGGELVRRAWPPTPLLWTKVGCGLVAVLANLICVVFVIQRKRRIDDPEEVKRLSHRVLLTGIAGPFFLTAAVLGLTFFRG